jgi:hypothetical protein
MTSLRAAGALCLGLSISTGACEGRPAPARQRESQAQTQAQQPPAEQGPQPRRPKPEPPSEPDSGRSALETCVDAQLAARGLNEYGDPAGTMYAGGTPLFDETAPGGGGARARVPWILNRHPEIAAACGVDPKVSGSDRPGDR